MIEYENQTKETLMFFSGDGSWGSADDIVIVDVAELDGHLVDVIEEISEYDYPAFARWYVENQTHDQDPNDYTSCRVCELWQDGTETEILEMLENEEND